MTTLDEKATSARDVVRASECEATAYRLETDELTEASEIGGESDFPQYGDFLDVVAVDGDGDDLGPRWVECPADLARSLVDAAISTGDRFQVTEAEKNGDGAWTFDVESL
jgi:hypothetical protein